MTHHNTENFLLDKCLKEIELKVSPNISVPPARKDFIFLSEEIFKDTTVLISISTLRRIWSKNFSTFPQLSTLNAFAKYLGYSDWNEFKKKTYTSEPTYSDTKVAVKKIKLINRNVKLITGTLFVILMAIYAHNRFNNEPSATLSPVKTESTSYPVTVQVNFTSNRIPSGDLVFAPFGNLAQSFALHDARGHIQQVYYIPGCFTSKLYLGEEVLAKSDICLYTDGWMAYAQKAGLAEFSDPYVFKTSEIYNNESLHIKPELLEQMNMNFHANIRSLIYILVQDFQNIYANGFELKCAIKNDFKQDGFHCQRANIRVFWQEGMVEIPIVQKGYERFLDVYLGNEIIKGSQTDLSFLQQDISDWQNISIQSNGKEIKFYMNDDLIQTFDLITEKSAIKGMKFIFHGSGSVKNIQLNNHLNKRIYQSNFNSPF